MPTRGKLTHDSIVQAAFSLLDDGGEKAFSMRKLATALNVDPMAIYHHHPSKSALIGAVLQAMMSECDLPEPSGNWQQDIRDLCQGLRHLAHKHPGTFRIYETFDDWLPAEHALHEAFHATLLNAGFAPQTTVRAMRLLLAYTEAFAVDEISGWFDPEDRTDLENSLKSGPYPATTSLLDEIVHSDTDAEFEFGLTVLLKGLGDQL